MVFASRETPRRPKPPVTGSFAASLFTSSLSFFLFAFQARLDRLELSLFGAKRLFA